MPEHRTGHRRRTILRTAGTAAALYGAGVGVATATEHAPRPIVLDNVGSGAWELVDADGENAGRVGAENPRLTLLVGERYEFENRGTAGHPLEFRDTDRNALLSQDTQGAFEDDPAVGYDEGETTMSFTLTPDLAAELSTYICTLHGAMVGNVETVATTEAAFAFGDQATASSSVAVDGRTTPGVLLEGVDADGDISVAVTYEDGDEAIVAGAERLEDPTGDDVVVPVADGGGVPGEHTAHALAADALEGYEPGDPVSADTADRVLESHSATVLQATVDAADGRVDPPVDDGEAIATVDASLAGDDRRYVVDLHPTDDDGDPIAEEFVGSSPVLTGEADEAPILAERVPADGAANELPLGSTDEFVAMIHVVDDGADAGTEASPGSFPVLPNVDGELGPVAGGVTDRATLAVGSGDAPEAGTPDTPDDAEDEPEPDAEDVQEQPGFGVASALAGLGGAGYLLRRRSTGTDDEP